MSKSAFFTDEDVYAAVAVALRKAGLDAVVRRLLHLADSLDASAMQDRLEFSGDW